MEQPLHDPQKPGTQLRPAPRQARRVYLTLDIIVQILVRVQLRGTPGQKIQLDAVLMGQASCGRNQSTTTKTFPGIPRSRRSKNVMNKAAVMAPV